VSKPGEVAEVLDLVGRPTALLEERDESPGSSRLAAQEQLPEEKGPVELPERQDAHAPTLSTW
jgi:hypothetical protein